MLTDTGLSTEQRRLTRAARTRFAWLSGLHVDGREQWLVAALALLLLSGLAVRHQYLTIGTVENDFTIVSRLATSLDAALRVHGYYPLGYPVMVLALSKLVGGLIPAAKVITIVSATGCSLIVYSIAATLFGRRVGLLSQLLTVVNWYYIESGLLVGSDAPWILAQSSALLMILLATKTGRATYVLYSGGLQGLAYLIRYQSVMGIAAIVAFMAVFQPLPGGRVRNAKFAMAFVVLFFVFASPQLVLSTVQHGQPFYNEQAKNVSAGLYRSSGGEIQFGRPSEFGDVGLLELVTRDPVAFSFHWLTEFAAYWTHVAGETTGVFPELMRSAPGGVRLTYGLAFLIGWLGVGVWALTRWGGMPPIRHMASVPRGATLLPVFAVFYGAGVALAYVLTRYVFIVAFLALPWVAYFIDGKPTYNRVRAGRLGMIPLAVGLVSLLVCDLLVADFTLSSKEMRVAEARTLLEQGGVGPEDTVMNAAAARYALQLPYRFVGLGRPVWTAGDLRDSLRAEKALYFLYDESVPDPSDSPVQQVMRSDPSPSFLELLGTSRPRGLTIALYRVRPNAASQN